MRVDPDVDMDAAGNFAVTWPSSNAGVLNFDVYARWFRANGTMDAQEILVYPGAFPSQR